MYFISLNKMTISGSNDNIISYTCCDAPNPGKQVEST